MALTDQSAKQRLVSLQVGEVSLVDRPAIVETFVVIKSEEPSMADKKIPETTAPATAATVATVAAPAPVVQAVTEVQKAKMSPEMMANCKAALKTLKDAFDGDGDEGSKKKKKAMIDELEAMVAEQPAEKDAGVLSGQTAITQAAPAGDAGKGVLSGETAITQAAKPPFPPKKPMSDEDKAKVKAVLDKAFEGLQDLRNGIDPLFWNQMIPTSADGQPSGAPKADDGKLPAAPAMGAPAYPAQQGALMKAVTDAVEAATATMKKSIDDAQKLAAEQVARAEKAAADANARVEQLEKTAGVSKSLPESGGEAKPVKKAGLWKGVL